MPPVLPCPSGGALGIVEIPRGHEASRVDISLRLVGQAGKRGIIPRLPTADRLVGDIERWVRTDLGETVRGTRCGMNPGGDAELLVDLHPAAPPLTFSADDAGRVTAHAVTASVGPGYHGFVSRAAERLGHELSIVWQEPGQDESAPGLPAEAGQFGARTRQVATRAHLAWLGSLLRQAQEARRHGQAGIHFGTPPDVRFTFEGALATALGPRDDAWLEAAATDARIAVEAWPWWADAMDARYSLNRALCLMWTEVRWRAPANDQERAVVDEALALLLHAFPLDPTLPFPWPEWQELLELRGMHDPRTRFVGERAAGVGEATPRVGYRRRPVTVLHEGWALEVPGTFTGGRHDDEWSGGEAGRNVTLAAVPTGTERGPMPPETFLARVAGSLGDGALTHRQGDLVGRARLSVDASSGVSVGVLEGYSAVLGRGAAIRIEFEDPEDWSWAVERWRALRPL